MKFGANLGSTLNLVRVASLLAGIVVVKAISVYYGFSWLAALAAQ